MSKKKEMDLGDYIEQMSKKKKNKIGVGIAKATPRVRKSLQSVAKVVDITVVGEKVPGLKHVASKTIDPLIEMVRDRQVDGMVRGNFDALDFYNAVHDVLQHEGPILEVNLIKLNGIKMIDEEKTGIFAPIMASPSNERTCADKMRQIDLHIEFFEKYGITPKIGLLSAGKPVDIEEAIPEIDKTLTEAEFLVNWYTEKGYFAKHYNHQVEYAVGECNIVVMQNAIAGNLGVHVMLYLGTTDYLGGIVTNVGDYVIVDDSEAMQDFSQCVRFANAMVNVKREGR